MPKKTFTPEQIVPKLRQIEVLIGQGKAVPLACKEAGITAQTFYRWRKEYGGLQLEQARRLKDLQKANAQLRRAVAQSLIILLRGIDGLTASLAEEITMEFDRTRS